jgi:hypothetical protein
MPDFRNLIFVRREQYPFDGAARFPHAVSGAVFIPGIGVGGVHYGFLVDFANRAITCWTIDLAPLRTHVLDLLSALPKPAVPWHQESLAKFIDVIHFPHSADYWNGWIYLTLIEGSVMLALHTASDVFEVICDPDAHEVLMYSSTNQIRDGKIYFSRWRIEDTFLHEADRSRAVNIEVGTYDLVDKQWRIGPVLSGPDDIHYTAVSPDHDHIVLVEMSQDPVIAMPLDRDFERLTRTEKRRIIEGGIHESVLITCHLPSGSIHRLRIAGGPAHIEWDDHESDVYYLSSHHLVTNNDTLYAFGSCRIDRFRLVDGRSHRECSYQTSDLLRGPSHRLTSWSGRSLMAIPVYPSRVDLVDCTTMSRYKRIELARMPRTVNFDDGPIRYPGSSLEKTPYTIDGQAGTSYLYLSTVWDVSVFDAESERKLGSVVYNRNKQMMMMGHASKFDLVVQEGRRA